MRLGRRQRILWTLLLARADSIIASLTPPKPTVRACNDCGEPTENGRARCPTHLAIHRQRIADRTNAWRDAGRCTSCGADELETKRLCAKCAAAMRRRTQERRLLRTALNLCVQCGKRPPIRTTLCGHCLETRRENNQRRRRQQ
jgi:hypothetical protein